MFFIVVLLTLAYFSIYYYCKQRFSYWRRKGIPDLEPSIPLGNLSAPWKKIPPSIQYANFYKEFKERGQKHGGVYLFTNPMYIPVDPVLVRNILVKDFHNFSMRGISFNAEMQKCTDNLFFLDGPRWKVLRQKVTPTFTSGKMKMMFTTMLNCAKPLVQEMKLMSANREAIDIKETLAKFTTDVIGSCAFGIDCNSFETPNSDLRKYGKMVFQETVLKSLKMLIAFNYRGLAKKLGITMFEKEVDEFFAKLATDAYNYRMSNHIKRNDFMQILIELKETENALTMNELIAQVFAFFVAGFDTSAATLTFCLFELASNLDIQKKLREEISNVLNEYDGEITYESLQDMKYLDQVISETLRKYPVASMIIRTCSEDYQIPFSNSTLEKGTLVLISALGLQRDPEYFPDPEKFDPDRFSNENESKIRPGTYLPFGDGPRICIGIRFGLMQVKICLISLLKGFEFSVNSKTKLPLEFDFGFVTNVKGGIWLNCQKIS
ncbi:cytochrome P450 [Oryctes borbonicus]|uniref:Cytochrome P450 n=1 Tax=Oryctes borbonicus TaxID=1629725 RepID=A0A0T6B8I1_9SCAR|nr:cytochrome P450 [Oryctes borbonicus]